METQKLIPVKELFKKSFALYKSKMYTMWLLALIPFASFVIVSLLTETTSGNVHNTNVAFGSGFLAAIFSLVNLVVLFWIRIAFFYSIKMNIDIKSLLKFSWIKFGPFAWISFFMTIAIFVGFILLIIPGIIFSVWFSLSLYLFAFEDVKGIEALKKSRELIRGYWWPVFGRLLLFGLIVVVIVAIPVIGELLNIFFFMPLAIIYGYFIYENLKTIKSQPSIL